MWRKIIYIYLRIICHIIRSEDNTSILGEVVCAFAFPIIEEDNSIYPPPELSNTDRLFLKNNTRFLFNNEDIHEIYNAYKSGNIFIRKKGISENFNTIKDKINTNLQDGNIQEMEVPTGITDEGIGNEFKYMYPSVQKFKDGYEKVREHDQHRLNSMKRSERSIFELHAKPLSALVNLKQKQNPATSHSPSWNFISIKTSNNDKSNGSSPIANTTRNTSRVETSMTIYNTNKMTVNSKRAKSKTVTERLTKSGLQRPNNQSKIKTISKTVSKGSLDQRQLNKNTSSIVFKSKVSLMHISKNDTAFSNVIHYNSEKYTTQILKPKLVNYDLIIPPSTIIGNIRLTKDGKPYVVLNGTDGKSKVMIDDKKVKDDESYKVLNGTNSYILSLDGSKKALVANNNVNESLIGKFNTSKINTGTSEKRIKSSSPDKNNTDLNEKHKTLDYVSAFSKDILISSYKGQHGNTSHTSALNQSMNKEVVLDKTIRNNTDTIRSNPIKLKTSPSVHSKLSANFTARKIHETENQPRKKTRPKPYFIHSSQLTKVKTKPEPNTVLTTPTTYYRAFLHKPSIEKPNRAEENPIQRNKTITNIKRTSGKQQPLHIPSHKNKTSKITNDMDKPELRILSTTATTYNASLLQSSEEKPNSVVSHNLPGVKPRQRNTFITKTGEISRIKHPFDIPSHKRKGFQFTNGKPKAASQPKQVMTKQETNTTVTTPMILWPKPSVQKPNFVVRHKMSEEKIVQRNKQITNNGMIKSQPQIYYPSHKETSSDVYSDDYSDDAADDQKSKSSYLEELYEYEDDDEYDISSDYEYDDAYDDDLLDANQQYSTNAKNKIDGVLFLSHLQKRKHIQSAKGTALVKTKLVNNLQRKQKARMNDDMGESDIEYDDDNEYDYSSAGHDYDYDDDYSDLNSEPDYIDNVRYRHSKTGQSLQGSVSTSGIPKSSNNRIMYLNSINAYRQSRHFINGKYPNHNRARPTAQRTNRVLNNVGSDWFNVQRQTEHTDIPISKPSHHVSGQRKSYRFRNSAFQQMNQSPFRIHMTHSLQNYKFTDSLRNKGSITNSISDDEYEYDDDYDSNDEYYDDDDEFYDDSEYDNYDDEQAHQAHKNKTIPVKTGNLNHARQTAYLSYIKWLNRHL